MKKQKMIVIQGFHNTTEFDYQGCPASIAYDSTTAELLPYLFLNRPTKHKNHEYSYCCHKSSK